MLLSKLLELLTDYTKENFQDVEINGISYNSSTVKSGDIFICIKAFSYSPYSIYKYFFVCIILFKIF